MSRWEPLDPFSISTVWQSGPWLAGFSSKTTLSLLAIQWGLAVSDAGVESPSILLDELLTSASLDAFSLPNVDAMDRLDPRGALVRAGSTSLSSSEATQTSMRS